MADGADAELSELGQAADWYVRHGFAVIPLGAKSKKPCTQKGLNDWTDNPKNVHDFWADHPNRNIGIVCGQFSGGLLVLDFDVDESKDKDGLATLYEWEKVHGELPETAVAITGSGGMHYLYHTDRTNIHPSTNAELGVDVRTDGSYIVAPPSIHPSGRRYEWQDSPEDTPIAMADANVYDFLDHIQRNGGTDDTKKPNGKFKLPKTIAEGKRDDTLFRYGAHLRGLGRSDEEILTSLIGANMLNCKPPLEMKDIERIHRSVCRYERGEDGGSTSGWTPGKPGSKAEAPSFLGKRGGVDAEKLGDWIIEGCRARIIDGAPAVWTGQRWEFGARAIKRAAARACRSAKISDKNEVLSHVMDLAPQVSSDTEFDGRFYVQFQDGTYDVQAGMMVEPTPEMYIVGTMPVPLDLDAPYGLADQFLSSIAGRDAVVEQAMREVLGACMCSRRIVSEAPMLIGRANGGIGKAANGKSTYINWIASIIGTENTSSLSIEDFQNRFQRGLAVGKLANLGDDMSGNYLKDEALSIFKKLVTGDTIFADVKGTDGFEYRPSATQIFSMNQIPRLSDTTEGVFRRLYFLPFYGCFRPGDEGYDPHMGRRLAQMENRTRGALLGLMALPDLIERSEFVRIKAMEAEVEKVRADNSSVIRWVMDEGITADMLLGRPVKEVFGEYSAWCEESGEQFRRQKETFSQHLSDYMTSTAATGRMFKSASTKISGKSVRVYKWVDIDQNTL